MVWVGGQVDLTPGGTVCNADDPVRQVFQSMKNFDAVLGEFGSSLEDLVYLNAFYVRNDRFGESEFLDTIAATLPAGTRTAITTVPVPCLAYPGMMVEIEGYAMTGQDGQRLSRQYAPETAPGSRPGPFCTAVRCGKMIFLSAQSPCDRQGNILGRGNIVVQTRQVSRNLLSALSHFGADFDDVVKTNRWYAGGVGIEDFEPAALEFAANFTEPGPAATGIPVPCHDNPDELIRIALIAMLEEDGSRLPRKHAWPETLWDWHVHLPYKHGLKCDNMIFLGGQVSLDKRGVAVHPDDLSAQTHQAMKHIGTILDELGAGYSSICKIMTVYRGEGADALHANLPIRSSYFRDPGPATTGIPLPVLAYDSMCIEIDVYAMADPDLP